MRQRSTLPRREPVEWGVRIGLAIGAAWLCYGAVTHSLAYRIRGAAPERAHALAPWDGRITASWSEKLSGPEASAADRGEADRLAWLALRQDPTAVAAAATLGINSEIRGDHLAARQRFAYSEKLSRRNLQTRLWAIEDAVARGDISNALYHYDIALRTSRTAPDLLFPVLAGALTDVPIRTALVRKLAERPIWGDLFVSYVSDNGPNTQATAAFYTALHQRGIHPSEAATAALLTRLLSENHVDAAWAYYAAINPGVERSMSRDPGFTANRMAPSPFDWTPVIDTGTSATVQRGERGGIFDFSAPPNLGGPVLRQTQLLPAGEYILAGQSIGIDQPAGSAPYWTLTCSDGRELGRIPVPNSAQNSGRFSGRFVVSTACPVQQLTLVLRPSDQLSGVSGQIDNVQLRPAGR